MFGHISEQYLSLYETIRPIQLGPSLLHYLIRERDGESESADITSDVEEQYV